jgi:hypothetical protein
VQSFSAKKRHQLCHRKASTPSFIVIMPLQRTLTRLRSVGLKKALQMKWENFLWTRLYSFGEMLGLSILPAHFYSPVPSARELRRSFARWYAPSELAGVNMNLDGQRAFAQNLVPYKAECAALPDYASITQLGLGEGYAVVDAHLLYAMLRHLKPRRIIEVGSGVSTFFELEALKKNALEASADASAANATKHPIPKPQAPSNQTPNSPASSRIPAKACWDLLPAAK